MQILQIPPGNEMATQKCVAIFFSHASHSCTHFPRCHGGVMAACQIRQFGGAGSIPVRGSDKTNDEVVASPLPRCDDLGTYLVVRVGRATCRPCLISSHIPKATPLVHFLVTRLAQGQALWVPPSEEMATQKCVAIFIPQSGVCAFSNYRPNLLGVGV